MTASVGGISVWGRGRTERQKIRSAVKSPEINPDKIPSPESRTAVIPPIKALKNREQRDRGLMIRSGSDEEAATAQKQRSKIKPETDTAICDFMAEAGMLKFSFFLEESLREGELFFIGSSECVRLVNFIRRKQKI